MTWMALYQVMLLGIITMLVTLNPQMMTSPRSIMQMLNTRGYFQSLRHSANDSLWLWPRPSINTHCNQQIRKNHHNIVPIIPSWTMAVATESCWEIMEHKDGQTTLISILPNVIKLWFYLPRNSKFYRSYTNAKLFSTTFLVMSNFTLSYRNAHTEKAFKCKVIILLPPPLFYLLIY